MLVLTRKRSESIRVGNDIVIKVIHTSKGTVKLGIDAPPHVRVLRGELAEFTVSSNDTTEGGTHPENLETSGSPTSDEDGVIYFEVADAMDVETLMECVGAH